MGRAIASILFTKELIEMKAFRKTLLAATLLAIAAITVPATANAQTMYRLYNDNPASGEHFYTSSNSERDNLISLGWTYEGAGWDAPTSGANVYRLYNANGGEHHYTLSTGERDMLIAAGWTYEGVGWKSSDKNGTPLYRQYNPNQFANNHNYTSSTRERDNLLGLGWHNENVSWYGTKDSAKVVAEAENEKTKVIAEAKKQAQTVHEQPASKSNLWWRAQAVSVEPFSYNQRLYILNDTNQPGCVTQVLESGPEDAPTRAMIYTRETPDKTETYVKEEAWREEVYHYESRVYDPYTKTYYKTYQEYLDAWAAGGRKYGMSYNNTSVKVHDGWIDHPAVTDTRTVKGTIHYKTVAL
jgi:hypothetical protein